MLPSDPKTYLGLRIVSLGFGRGSVVRFLVVFLVLLLILFSLYSANPVRRLMVPLREITAVATGHILGAVGLGTQVSGDIVQLDDCDAGFRVVDECTAITAIMIYVSFLIAFPAAWRRKLVGCAVGVPLLALANLARLVGSGIVLRFRPQVFDFLHDYFWQFGFIVLTLGMALVWARWAMIAPAHGAGTSTPAPVGQPSRVPVMREGVVAAVLPALAAVLVFAGTLRNGLVYDDAWMLGAAPRSAAGWLDALFAGRGLTYAMYAFDGWLWGPSALGFHLSSVVLHALASFLAAFGGWSLTSSRRVGVLCGLLFAVHPVHVEAVSSIAYRGNLLATIFVLLALISWLRIRGSLRRSAATIGCIAAAWLAGGPGMMLLVPVLFLIDLTPRDGGPDAWTDRLGLARSRILPVGAPALAVALWLAAGIGARFGSRAIGALTEGHLWGYGQVLATTAAAVPEFLRLLFVPLRLSAEYPIQPEVSIASWLPALGVVVAVVWILGALLAVRRAPLIAFGMAWMLLFCLPCTNLIPASRSFVMERCLYAASFGACLLIAALFDRLLATARRVRFAWLRIAASLCVVIVILWGGVRSSVRVLDWRSDTALWSAALRDGFESWRTHHFLGSALVAEGSLEEGIAHLRYALALSPESASTHNDLGNALSLAGKAEEAIEEYREAVHLDPDNAEVHYNLGLVLYRQSGAGDRQGSVGDAHGRVSDRQTRLGEAIESLRRTVSIAPTHRRAHGLLGLALADSGDLDGGLVSLRKAVDVDPEHLEARFQLARILRELGRPDDAVQEYRSVLEIDPTAYLAHFNIGSALLQQGKIDLAIIEYERALEIRPGDGLVRRALNEALALPEARGE